MGKPAAMRLVNLVIVPALLISQPVLAKAQAGVYPIERAKDIPDDLLRRASGFPVPKQHCCAEGLLAAYVVSTLRLWMNTSNG